MLAGLDMSEGRIKLVSSRGVLFRVTVPIGPLIGILVAEVDFLAFVSERVDLVEARLCTQLEVCVQPCRRAGGSMTGGKS